MKITLLLSTAMLLALAACAPTAPEDRAAVRSSAAAAEDARVQSIQASENARIAREEAEKARDAAQRASDRADRIFREGQNK